MVRVLTDQVPLVPAPSQRRRVKRTVIVPAPSPLPQTPPRPHGDLENASLEKILDVVNELWPRDRQQTYTRSKQLEAMLIWLRQFPGRSWQERWAASGLDGDGRKVCDLDIGAAWLSAGLTLALKLLFALRVVRPSLAALRTQRFVRYNDYFEAAQQDPDLVRVVARIEEHDTTAHFKRCARFDLAAALTTQGVDVAGLTPEGLLDYAVRTRAGGWGSTATHYIGHLPWQVLKECGYFGPDVPATLRGAIRAPAKTPAELVDYYQIANAEVRDMLVAYLTRRSHDIGYSTLNGLAADLCKHFWKQIEAINPVQENLALSEETYQAWRAALAVRSDGRPRLGADSIVTNVRGLYLNIQGWAAEAPETWGRWAAPSPMANRETRSRAKAKRRAKERMDDRIRTLQPALPHFVKVVSDRRDHLRQLLEAATGAADGDRIVVGDKTYRRVVSVGDARYLRLHRVANLRVVDEATGTAINVTECEDAAFWHWAMVATLQHTGVRCEELLELSQLSIRQYQRSNGEVIALLVVAPSKNDRERVIPMSADLFHVIATIIRRLTRDRKDVPLATRYDKAECVTSPPQPFLFQRTTGQRTEVISPSALRGEFAKLSKIVAAEHPALDECRFTPHDLRRLFATDLVNHGLPIHIGAALLGHLDVQTTHGYVTVFNEDVVRHYQTHLANRRTARPATEYQALAPGEWDDFENHFDKRKVELGQCGRPYATPCKHEHACIRCPMLHTDPGVIDRLDEIDTDLQARRVRAESEGWLGELEGIDLTRRFLADKRADAGRRSALIPVNLGMPYRTGS